MTKVTHYMYSCDTCYKIREGMKLMAYIVPSVKNPKLRDMMGIFGMFNEEKDKKPNSDLLLQMKLSTKTCSSWCERQ